MACSPAVLNLGSYLPATLRKQSQQMLAVDRTHSRATQTELTPGETVLWAARPRAGVLFHGNENEPQVLFSLLWGGFATIWRNRGDLVVLIPTPPGPLRPGDSMGHSIRRDGAIRDLG